MPSLLTRLRRSPYRVTVAAGLLVTAAIIGWRVNSEVQFYRQNLDRVLLAELQASLGKAISARRIVLRRGEISAETVKLAAGPTFDAGTLGTADRVVIHYDERALIAQR